MFIAKIYIYDIDPQVQGFSLTTLTEYQVYNLTHAYVLGKENNKTFIIFRL